MFSKNRDRLLEGDIAAKFLAAVLAQPKVKKLLSSDHFSVDGTLIEAWASMKSVKPKDGSGEPPAQGGGRNVEADFHGQKRSNDTHASTTDPDARQSRSSEQMFGAKSKTRRGPMLPAGDRQRGAICALKLDHPVTVSLRGMNACASY